MEQIRTGIIGLGMIGTVHLDALRRIPGITVTAICGPTESKLKDIQAAFGIKRIFTDWQDLVECSEVDAVHNCTPNHMHREINEACLQAGKVIFSEKPLGMDSYQTKAIADLAERTGVPAGVNFCYRYYPTVQWARHLIREGFIGDIRAVHGHYLQDWLMFPEDFNWRVDSRQGGSARTLGDIGSHWLDLAQYVTGLEIEQVFADLGTLLPRRKDPDTNEWVEVDTEDWATTLLKFSGGVKGNFTVSQISGGHKNDLQLEVVGSKASLRWNQEQPEMLWVGKRGGENQLMYKEPDIFTSELQDFAKFPAGHSEGYGDCVMNSISNFYNCVRINRFDYPTFAWGHRITELTTAIIESSKAGVWINCSPIYRG